MNPFPKHLNMVTPDQLDRRSVLKGITFGAGAVVLQPFLNALAAEARGEAPPPRIVFVVEANGLWEWHIRPQTLGKAGGATSAADKLVDAPLAGHKLPEAIAPLEGFKDRMSIVLGLSSKHVNPNHGGGYGAFNGCAQGAGQWAVRAQTIDHALASNVPAVLPVVGLGVPASPDRVFANWLSVSAPGRPMPIICQPEVAFRMLFGSAAEGDAGKMFQARNKLLDWCSSDIKRVRDELPPMDREKLDVYLDTFEQMRSRQQQLSDIKDRLKANLPALDKFDCKRTTGRFEAQCSVAVAALASRLTNVVMIDTACGYQGYHTWTDLGVTVDGHTIGHTHPDDPKRNQSAVPIRRFYAERVADIARRMAAVKEGNGTMLDNSLIIYLSDSAEEHHGTGGQWPMILVGNLGGRLKTAGRFLQFPGYNKAGHRTMANFFLSLLQAVGDKREKFGEPDRELADINTAGPLTEILA